MLSTRIWRSPCQTIIMQLNFHSKINFLLRIFKFFFSSRCTAWIVWFSSEAMNSVESLMWWSKCKNFVSAFFFFLSDVNKMCWRISGETIVQIAWRCCSQAFLPSDVSCFVWMLSMCVVLHSLYLWTVILHVSLSHCHISNTIVRILATVFYFPCLFSFPLFYSTLFDWRWKVLNEQLQNEIEMWETIRSFDKGNSEERKKNTNQSLTNVSNKFLIKLFYQCLSVYLFLCAFRTVNFA